MCGHLCEPPLRLGAGATLAAAPPVGEVVAACVVPLLEVAAVEVAALAIAALPPASEPTIASVSRSLRINHLLSRCAPTMPASRMRTVGWP